VGKKKKLEFDLTKKIWGESKGGKTKKIIPQRKETLSDWLRTLMRTRGRGLNGS